MTDFESVVPALGQALTKRGYAVLTPVQEAVLVPELRDADMLVSAQTGSGKTVAFGLALAPTLLAGADRFVYAPAPLALVVAPTRELALQVKRELEWLYEPTGASVASCVGGMDMRDERRVLERGAHIVVGTPGRLRDHIERGSLDMTCLRAVVLDEADEMLDLGFREDLEYILDAAPADRRTLMFSATVPRSIATLAKRYQRDSVRVSTSAEHKQHVDIEYRALTVAPNDRENAIINVLRYFEAKNALVFCATRATVNHMTSRFTNRGFAVVALSGELSQNERTHALQAMRDGRARVCIATDVAARGIDLPNLELVIHADLPTNRETLLHRSGRTGRAGRKGVCVLIVPHNARRRTEQLLRHANVEAAWARPPSIDEIVQRDRERMLDDPSLSEQASEDEHEFARELVARHGAEKVAAAFVRLYRAGQSAPEELLDTGPPDRPERPEKKRDDFKNGVWFSLSVGRKHNAEPRWLVPMLCRAGHITKRDIGAIRIRPDETHVELAPDCVDRFLEALGPGRMVEKTVSLKPLDGEPPKAGPNERGDIPDKSNTRQYAKKRPFRPDARTMAEPKPVLSRKPDMPAESDKPRETSDKQRGAKKPYKPGFVGKSAARAAAHSKPEFARKPDAPADDDKPRERAGAPSKGKKRNKPGFGGKSAARPSFKSYGAKSHAGTEKPGFAPRKRKTLRKKVD